MATFSHLGKVILQLRSALIDLRILLIIFTLLVIISVIKSNVFMYLDVLAQTTHHLSLRSQVRGMCSIDELFTRICTHDRQHAHMNGSNATLVQVN